MLESLKRLRNFVGENQLLPIDLYKHIRFCESEAIADIEKARKYLLKDLQDVAKIHQMMSAVKVKEHLVKNRDHTRGKTKIPYDVYKEIFPNGTMSLSHFNEVFEIVDVIELSQEQMLGKDASKAVAQWIELGEDRESILRILRLLAHGGGFGFSEVCRVSKVAANGEETNKKLFKKIFDGLVKSGRNRVVDALCALNFGEKADTALENSVVYYEVTSHLREENTTLIVEPSCAFIRKWLSDEYIKKHQVTFALSNENIRDILAMNYKGMENVRFISVEDIEETIETKKTPNHVIVFGARYYEVATLLQALKEGANSVHRISIFAPDKRFVEANLQNEVCDDKVKNIGVTLYPSGITGETSPKRKALFSILLAAPNGKEMSVVGVKSYSLVKNSPQKLRKNLLTVEVPLKSYVAGASFREEFRKKEQDLLRKTAQKRAKAYELQFTEEITICYTMAICGDGRLNVCSYVKNPAGASAEDISKLTRKNTRKLREQDVQRWLKEIYPYEELRTGEKKISIRAEIGRILRDLYRGKTITFNTLVYIYPMIEQRLNRREKKQLRKVCESELGDVQVDELSSDYIESVIDDLYAKEDDDVTNRYVVLKVVSMALEVAVRQGHVKRNCLGNLLDRENREKKRMRAVFKNLVKKNFSRREMRAIYDFVLGKIKRGAHEYIGILIRLLTGLESSVVCALKWRDFFKADDSGCFKEDLWQLNVCRKVRRDGGEFFSFDKAIENRKIPCADLLVQALLCERKRQLAIFGSEALLANQQILQAKKGMVRTTGVPVFPPDLLNRCGREAMGAAGIDEQLIRLTTEDGGIIEADLNKYHGDIFKRNHSHWAKKDRRWKEGELAYVMGNTPKDVFSDRYEHFEPAISQHILLKKQESIAAELLDEVALAVREEVEWNDTTMNASKETNVSTPVSKTSRTQTTVDLSTEIGDKETRLTFTCEYGFDIIISEVD